MPDIYSRVIIRLILLKKFTPEFLADMLSNEVYPHCTLIFIRDRAMHLSQEFVLSVIPIWGFDCKSLNSHKTALIPIKLNSQ